MSSGRVLGLADVTGSAAARLEVPGFEDRLDLAPVEHVIVVLIDGLGLISLIEHQDAAPFLSAHLTHRLRTVFPSTTPAGLGTLGTGLAPGAHGLIAATFEVPETGTVLAPLHWGLSPTPQAAQPEPTIFERAARAGVQVTSIGPAKYEQSGLTRAVLRGAQYQGAEDAASRVQRVSALRGVNRKLTYVYWPDLDKLGHTYGAGSAQWVAGLRVVDDLVMQVAAVAGASTSIIVTSDHGMVTCTETVHVEREPILMSGVRLIAGEPRVRHVYCHPGAQSDVLSAWSSQLAGRATVLSRQELIDSGMLGSVEWDYIERIGDVVAVATGTTALSSDVDGRVSALVGQHGSTTDAEMLIPAVVIQNY